MWPARAGRDVPRRPKRETDAGAPTVEPEVEAERVVRERLDLVPPVGRHEEHVAVADDDLELRRAGPRPRVAVPAAVHGEGRERRRVAVRRLVQIEALRAPRLEEEVVRLVVVEERRVAQVRHEELRRDPGPEVARGADLLHEGPVQPLKGLEHLGPDAGHGLHEARPLELALGEGLERVAACGTRAVSRPVSRETDYVSRETDDAQSLSRNQRRPKSLEKSKTPRVSQR